MKAVLTLYVFDLEYQDRFLKVSYRHVINELYARLKVSIQYQDSINSDLSPKPQMWTITGLFTLAATASYLDAKSPVNGRMCFADELKYAEHPPRSQWLGL